MVWHLLWQKLWRCTNWSWPRVCKKFIKNDIEKDTKTQWTGLIHVHQDYGLKENNGKLIIEDHKSWNKTHKWIEINNKKLVDNKMYSNMCFTHSKMICWVFALGVIVPYSLLFSCPPFLEHPWNLVSNPKLHTNLL